MLSKKTNRAPSNIARSLSTLSPQGDVSRNAKCRKAYYDYDCLLCRKTSRDTLFTATTHSAFGNKIFRPKGGTPAKISTK